MSKFIKSYRKIYITRKKTANCYLPVYVTIFYICLFLSTGMYYGQDGKNVDSRVIEATVFKDRALITRKARLQLPIAMNEKIRIKLLEPEKKMDELGNDQKLEWYLKLKPGEKKSILMKYQVEFPKNMHVYGLE